MQTFELVCSCGDSFDIDAPSREAAVAKAQRMMQNGPLSDHMKEQHAGEPLPNQEEIDLMIADEVEAS